MHTALAERGYRTEARRRAPNRARRHDRRAERRPGAAWLDEERACRACVREHAVRLPGRRRGRWSIRQCSGCRPARREASSGRDPAGTTARLVDPGERDRELAGAEVPDDRCRGAMRHLVLAGAAAMEYADVHTERSRKASTT